MLEEYMENSFFFRYRNYLFYVPVGAINPPESVLYAFIPCSFGLNIGLVGRHNF